jgi:hypothetical protein
VANFKFGSAFRDADFSRSMGFLYGVSGISLLEFLIKKFNFFQFLIIPGPGFALTKCGIRIRIETNADPKTLFRGNLTVIFFSRLRIFILTVKLSIHSVFGPGPVGIK